MTPYLRAGSLNRKMVFQVRGDTVDAWGQRSTAWVDVFSAMVSIRPLGGRELVNAQAIAADARHEVRLRYRPGLTTEMRGVYDGKFFNLLSVSDDHTAHRTLTLLCSEGMNEG